MTDLVEWLETAISAVEKQQGVPCNPGPARLTPCPVCGATLGMWSRIREAFWEWKSWRDTDGAVWHSMEPCNCPLTYEQWVQVVDAKPNPNPAVLRRCLADRKILELHRQVPADVAGDECNEPTGCQICGKALLCDWIEGNGVCDTVLALAEGHGYQEETA